MQLARLIGDLHPGTQLFANRSKNVKSYFSGRKTKIPRVIRFLFKILDYNRLLMHLANNKGNQEDLSCRFENCGFRIHKLLFYIRVNIKPNISLSGIGQGDLHPGTQKYHKWSGFYSKHLPGNLVPHIHGSTRTQWHCIPVCLQNYLRKIIYKK